MRGAVNGRGLLIKYLICEGVLKVPSRLSAAVRVLSGFVAGVGGWSEEDGGVVGVRILGRVLCYEGNVSPVCPRTDQVVRGDKIRLLSQRRYSHCTAYRQ